MLPTKFFHSGYVLHESHLSLQISKHLLSCKWHNSPLRWKYRGSYPGDFLGSDIDALHESSTTSILVKRASSIHVHTTFPYTRFPIEMITSVEVTAISTETAVTSIEEVITNSIEEAAGHFHGSLFLLPRGESPKAFRRRHTLGAVIGRSTPLSLSHLWYPCRSLEPVARALSLHSAGGESLKAGGSVVATPRPRGRRNKNAGSACNPVLNLVLTYFAASDPPHPTNDVTMWPREKKRML